MADLFDEYEFDALPCVAALQGEKAVAVAVSGGPDSMALCWFLARWARRNKGPVIHVLTVDHGLRPESADEAKQVGTWVKDWPQVKHSVLRLKNLSADSRMMERARQARYEVLAAYCRKHKIKNLFLAHHRDDQAETFLFRLAKGSGLDGLAGMREVQGYDENLCLIRPLLNVSKQELVTLCEKNKIPFVRDPTNENTAYVRGRLRAAADVLAAEGLSAKRLSVTAARLARAREALEFYTDRLFAESVQEQIKGRIVFDYHKMEAAPAETRLRVLARAIDRLSLKEDSYGPRREKLEALVEAMFDSGRPFRRRSLAGLLFSCNRKAGKVIIEREKR